MKLFVENSIRFIVLVIVQIFLLNNIQFLGYINPMIYLLFVLLLPIHLNNNWVLFLAFFMGLTIDMFSDSMGMHTFSLVLVAFLRKPIIRLFLDLEEVVNITPNISELGITNYFYYISIFVFIHHTSLFICESFSFVNLQYLGLRILFSSLITIVLLFSIGIISFRNIKTIRK